MNSKKIKRNSGITLIALIITIIVMLILVSVTISMAINGGLFEKAGQAVSDTQNAIDKEQILANGRVQIGGIWYDSIDDYIKGIESEDQSGTTTGGEGNQGGTGGEGSGNGMLTYDQTSKDANGMLTANATYTSGTYTAVVPKGFKIVPGLNGTTTIADGLVIQDEEGNEFVWIPVAVTETDTETSIASFYRSKWSNNARTTGLSTSYKEPYTSGYTNEVAEYNAMLKSVYDNKGFYIGRYEAGAQKQDANGNIIARTDTANGTSKMVVQRDQYPYIYVGWGLTMSDYTSDVTYSSKNQGKGALYLSKELYGTEADEGKYGVTSTLCYGIMWDAMFDFIKDEDHNVTSSTDWGNYSNNLWTIDRKTARYTTSPSGTATWSLIDDETNDKKEKTSSPSILLTTGASDDFASKNIFDVAGNVFEWTNEAIASVYRVFRGGGYNGTGSDNPASNRSGDHPYSCSNGIGFRPALYITNE